MIYVLTESFNDYDQHGAVFRWAWTHKPSEKELADWGCDHFGRQGNEYSWYELEEIK